MAEKEAAEPFLVEGDLYFARIPGHPLWPCQLLKAYRAPPGMRFEPHTADQLLLRFFGDQTYGWYQPSYLMTYESKIDSCLKSKDGKKNQAYKRALEEIQEVHDRRAGKAPRTQHHPWEIRDPSSWPAGEQLTLPPEPTAEQLEGCTAEDALVWLRGMAGATVPAACEMVNSPDGRVASGMCWMTTWSQRTLLDDTYEESQAGQGPFAPLSAHDPTTAEAAAGGEGEETHADAPKKKRGRPPGSKNKVKADGVKLQATEDKVAQRRATTPPPEDEPESPKATHTEKVKEKAAKASKADKGADKPIKTEKDTDVPIKAEKNTDKPIKTEKIKVPAAAPPGEKQLVRSTKAYRIKGDADLPKLLTSVLPVPDEQYMEDKPVATVPEEFTDPDMHIQYWGPCGAEAMASAEGSREDERNQAVLYGGSVEVSPEQCLAWLKDLAQQPTAFDTSNETDMRELLTSPEALAVLRCKEAFQARSNLHRFGEIGLLLRSALEEPTPPLTTPRAEWHTPPPDGPRAAAALLTDRLLGRASLFGEVAAAKPRKAGHKHKAISGKSLAHKTKPVSGTKRKKSEAVGYSVGEEDLSDQEMSEKEEDLEEDSDGNVKKVKKTKDRIKALQLHYAGRPKIERRSSGGGSKPKKKPVEESEPLDEESESEQEEESESESEGARKVKSKKRARSSKEQLPKIVSEEEEEEELPAVRVQIEFKDYADRVPASEAQFQAAFQRWQAERGHDCNDLPMIGPYKWRPYDILRLVADEGGYEAVRTAGRWHAVAAAWQNHLDETRAQGAPIPKHAAPHTLVKYLEQHYPRLLLKYENYISRDCPKRVEVVDKCDEKGRVIRQPKSHKKGHKDTHAKQGQGTKAKAGGKGASMYDDLDDFDDLGSAPIPTFKHTHKPSLPSVPSAQSSLAKAGQQGSKAAQQVLQGARPKQPAAPAPADEGPDANLRRIMLKYPANTTMPSAARAGFILNQWIPNLDRQTVVVNANKNVITADCKTHTEANTALSKLRPKLKTLFPEMRLRPADITLCQLVRADERNWDRGPRPDAQQGAQPPYAQAGPSPGGPGMGPPGSMGPPGRQLPVHPSVAGRGPHEAAAGGSRLDAPRRLVGATPGAAPAGGAVPGGPRPVPVNKDLRRLVGALPPAPLVPGAPGAVPSANAPMDPRRRAMPPPQGQFMGPPMGPPPAPVPAVIPPGLIESAVPEQVKNNSAALAALSSVLQSLTASGSVPVVAPAPGPAVQPSGQPVAPAGSLFAQLLALSSQAPPQN